MALFKYVGSKTKANGKVDVRVGTYSFEDITPNTYTIEVATDSKEEKALEYAVDPLDHTYMYVKQS